MTWRSTSATSAPSGVLPGRRMIADRLAGRRLVDVDRQEAAAVVVGVEQRELLAAVNPVLGVVDVEHDAPGHLLEAVAEQLDHRRHHALERGRAGQVLQPADGRLRAQIVAALRQPPDRHLEGRIGFERVAVVAVGIARRDQQRAVADHLGKPVPHPFRIARGPRCRRPAARRSRAAARSPPAAISRRPRSAGRRRKRHAPACPPPLANPAKSPYLRPWRARTPLPSVDPASATKSYTNPTAYAAPATPFTQPGEFFRLEQYAWLREVQAQRVHVKTVSAS